MQYLKPPPRIAPVIWAALVLASLGFGYYSARAFFLNAVATRLDTQQEGAEAVVDRLSNGSSDPDAHSLAANYYERISDFQDLDRALMEYRKAAELSPHAYLAWLNLAMSLSRRGEVEAADDAFKRASELAPNYASVLWARGNFLIRQNRLGEGTPMILRAALGDPRFMPSAVSLVVQLNDGDIARTRGMLGDDAAVNACLALFLTSQKRYGEAHEVWDRVPIGAKQSEQRETAKALLASFLQAKQYRAAASVSADLADADAERPVVGKVTNGGFESAIKLHDAPIFTWQIADGAEPQIGLSTTQKHTGTYGLVLTFNTFKTEGFRSISQAVLVEPGAKYRLVFWYKSTLKTDAKFRWRIATTGGGSPLGTAAELVPAGEWTAVTTSFAMPQDVDVFDLSLTREGCNGPACVVTGSIAFDDFELVRE